MVKLALATTPAAVWWVLDKLRLYPSSIKGIEAVAQRGTEVLVACSESEFSKFARRSGWTVRSLERSGTCHFEVVESMDHALFNFTGRAALIKLFTAQVTEKLIPEFGRALDEEARKGGSDRRLALARLTDRRTGYPGCKPGLQSAEGVSRSSVRALRIEPSDSKVLLLSMCSGNSTPKESSSASITLTLA